MQTPIIYASSAVRKQVQMKDIHSNKLEQSNFFSQSTGGKIKIRLEKRAVNISKITGGKTEKFRRGPLHEKLRLDLYFVYKKH